MLTDKEQKKKFKVIASKEPTKYYPTSALKKEGFHRNKCSKCNKYFWNIDEKRKVCGDAACTGGFDLASGTPAKNKLSYIQVWDTIKKMFKPLGYSVINRYPVVARWNPTTDFVIASIAAFQPYVITGEVDPPAKKLVIPQFSLRFSDIDNVGITGSHCTGFVMIGQHAFLSSEEWDQEQFFMDIYNFLIKGVGLAKAELTIHEDAWAGGGSFGPCMEFFSRGIELFNQVYTMFEQTPSGNKALKLKVLDMGLGMERVAWFSQGTSNMYEAIFPSVLKKLRLATKVEIDLELYKEFSKYSAYLNVDETENIDNEWKKVASKLNMDVDKLKKKIWPNVAIYSLAEHSRTLLVALTDGALPSNVGGGYNLRVILRRMLSFIDEFNWDIKLIDIMKWHAKELKDLFPELGVKLKEVEDIINNEIEKYEATKKKAYVLVQKLLNKKISEKDLLELYDSNGISPDIVKAEAKKNGKEIKIPDNFYVKVTELHEKKEQVHATAKEVPIDLSSFEHTLALYFDNYSEIEFKAKVVFVKGEYIVLDKTAFYPTSGGQLHDTGLISDHKVVNVIKQDNVIVHVVPGNKFKVGETVTGIIDMDRRKQLTQLHTATHIVNSAAQQVLGSHVNQAGAKKVLDKAHLDITHYKAITLDEQAEIEKIANSLVAKKIKIQKSFMSRKHAEASYGMNIYQGGAIPGNELRIVNIPGYDVECCAGTHLNNTSEVGKIKIQKTSKISDGIVRITFTAGEALNVKEGEMDDILVSAAKLLSVEIAQVPARAEELFLTWKKAKKALKKGKVIDLKELDLKKIENYSGDVLNRTAQILKTQKEHVVNTLSRFKNELDEIRKKLS